MEKSEIWNMKLWLVPLSFSTNRTWLEMQIMSRAVASLLLPVGQEKNISSIFLSFSCSFSHFPQFFFFSIFFITWSSRWAACPPGKALAAVRLESRALTLGYCTASFTFKQFQGQGDMTFLNGDISIVKGSQLGAFCLFMTTMGLIHVSFQ